MDIMHILRIFSHKNMVYAQKVLTENADTSIFFAHVRHVAIAGIVQLIIFVYIIAISVVKPWKKTIRNANMTEDK